MQAFETKNVRWFTAVLFIGSVLIAGYLDHLTGTTASPLLFYLAAVAVISAHSGWQLGIVSAIASATSWHVVNHIQGSPVALVWNDLSRIAVLGLAAAVASWVSEALIERSARNP